MTNLQKHTKKVLRKFYKQFYLSTHDNELPKDIEDYFMPSDITYCEMKDFILQALSERDEVIVKMLESIEHPDVHYKFDSKGRKLIALDKAISIIKGDNPTNGEINKDVPTLKGENE